MVRTDYQIITAAELQAASLGLSALDALHLAAAKSADVSEFVTGEKSTKPVFRDNDMTVISIRPE